MCFSNYSGITRFHTIIAKIKWHSFCPTMYIYVYLYTVNIMFTLYLLVSVFDYVMYNVICALQNLSLTVDINSI